MKESWRPFQTVKSFLQIRPVNHGKQEWIENHVFIYFLYPLIARLFEKSMNNEITMSMISDVLSPIKTA